MGNPDAGWQLSAISVFAKPTQKPDKNITLGILIMCNGIEIVSAESSSVLNTFIGAVLGFAAAVFAEPLRQWIYRPNLKLQFDDDPGCRSRTPEQAQEEGRIKQEQSIHEADYIRIKVTNTKPVVAKKCRAYLVGIEKKSENSNAFNPTTYGDSIPLPWSCRGVQAYDPLDLPKDIVQFLDVVSTRSISTYFKPEIQPIPYRYLSLFQQQGTFRFTVQVSGENVTPVFIKIVFRWDGTWDKYEASLG